MADEFKKRNTGDDDDMPTSPAWMATFSDMMTLLMCFFILIMSFSTLELDKFKMAMGSLQGALGVLGTQKKLRPEQSWFSPSATTMYSMQQKSVLEHLEKLQSVIKKNELEDQVDAYMADGEVYIEIRDSMLFGGGSADLRPNYLKLLSIISKTVFKDAKSIVVEGHTDNIPIQTAQYPSNWELSMHRALQVVKYFVDKTGIDPAMVSAAGYGEHKPIVPNNSAKNRAINRRVVLKMKL